MIVLIGMAVGVDYSLFYLKREREERAAGRSTLDAVEIAAQTSGHSILVSGGAVIASMAGLYVIGDATFNSLATGAILVVAIAVLGSITVLPALLVKLGRWVDRPRVPLLWRLNRRIGRGGISSRILAPVLRHPARRARGLRRRRAAAGAAGARACGSTRATCRRCPPRSRRCRPSRGSPQEFPAEGTTATVVVKASAGGPCRGRSRAPDLDRAADRHPGLRRARARTRSGSRRTAPPRCSTSRCRTTSRTRRSTAAIESLRADLAPAAPGRPRRGVRRRRRRRRVAGLRRTGSTTGCPIVIGVVLLLTLLMMGFAFRSVPIALVSTALNLASVGVAFGILTLVFQHGWGAGALDFTSPGFVIDWIPLFVMVVLVGPVDGLPRVRDQPDPRARPGRTAAPGSRSSAGIRDTAGVVTSAAAVMVSVFAIFATLSMMEMKMMGVGLSAAILVDATVIRLVMLPAILVLLGDRAWWPAEPAGRRSAEVGGERAGVRAVGRLTGSAAGRRHDCRRRPAGCRCGGLFSSHAVRRCRGRHPEVEVRRSRRRKRTVSAYRRDGKVIVMIPDRFTRAEEAEWVTTMLERLDKSEQRRRRTDDQLMRRARELCRDYLHDKVERRPRCAGSTT